MATTTDELKRLEEKAAEHLEDEAGHVGADLDAAADAVVDEDAEPERPANRLAVAVALPTLAAALMVGGIFTGPGAEIYACIAGLLGIGLALLARNIKKALNLNLVILVGLFAIGLLMVISEPGKIPSIRAEVAEAARQRTLFRPPVALLPGWQAIIGWLMGIVGFAAAWVAIVLKRPSLALLLPLPVAAISAISLPKEPEMLQIGYGIAALALFAMGLGVLSSAQAVGPDDEKVPLSYELRKVAKALPLVAIICAALVAMAQVGFLFPDPLHDPTEKPKKPKTTSQSEVEDRVLFAVRSPSGGPPEISGPWRTGGLDVYQDDNWLLAPIGESELENIKSSGIVDQELQKERGQGIEVQFELQGLTGAILPSLPNTVGVAATGPVLAYDERNANIRLSEGTFDPGFTYRVTAAALPKIEELRQSTASVPAKERELFLDDMPEPPPAVRDFIDATKAQLAAEGRDNRFDLFDRLRNYILDNVTVTGSGVPIAVPPERVADMVSGVNAEGTPFEIVAAQALLARWVGLPSRIGYGFDGGELINDSLEVRPRNGATFVEVYFPSYKWLPIIGTPKKAKPSGDNSDTQTDPTIVPSEDISVQLFLPVVVPPESILFDQLRRIILLAIPIILLLIAIYTTYPGVRKVILRNRRRGAAEAAGPRARIALSYAEWRDHATDFGFRYGTDTPLMFLDRFIDDDEHTEFAWLVTRALWGDLQHDITPEMAQASEELSRSLRRRLAGSQPGTVRAVALVSRLSLRHPYAPETDLTRHKEDAHVALAPV